MKKFLILAAFVAAAVLASACSVVQTNDGANEASYQVRKAVYDPVIKHENRKVIGAAKWNCLFGIFTWGLGSYAERTDLNDPFLTLETSVKKAAVYDACKRNDCDIILATKYELTKKNYFLFRSVSCIVTGFPGTITGLERVDLNAVPSGCCGGKAEK